MSEQSTPGSPAPLSERGGRLGRFRSKGAPAADRPTARSSGGGVDGLTRLPTRQVLHEWVNAAIMASRPTSSRCILAFVDLDSLRDVNDSYGPDAGDAVLAQVAGRLQDLGARALRYGGAEFALVYQGIDSMTAPDELALAVLDRITAPYDITGGQGQVTVACHVGLAIGGDAAGNVADLVRDAHQALVHARDLGPATYVVHDESRRGRYSTRVDEARLQTALENHEFLLHYQPIVRVDSGELIGVEALLRWQDPAATNTGMLFPHAFLPLLEKSGLIVPVGRWVIEETCRQAVAWTEAHPTLPPLFVTCNIGARQLAMPDFADTVLEAISITGVPARQLCLDITEQTLRYNGDSTWSALRRLKQAGVKLGLDDFGTGAASLTALREMNLDILRIDRTFITDLTDSAENRAIVRHVSNLAHELHMVTVAEGIESEEQAELLTDLGVDLAQGFLHGRPEAADRISIRLDPPDPDAPFTGPTGDTSVFPPPVFPPEQPPAAPPAATWPPADWTPAAGTAAEPADPAPGSDPEQPPPLGSDAGGTSGQWPDHRRASTGSAVDPPTPEG
ncbi:MAG: putative bifunctional diguanylate cyclase/phosphodiesterase [Acidimicrobiales bacterium]